MVHSYSANKELVLTEDVCPVIFSFIGFPGAALMQRFPQWKRVLGESQMPWTHSHLCASSFPPLPAPSSPLLGPSARPPSPQLSVSPGLSSCHSSSMVFFPVSFPSHPFQSVKLWWDQRHAESLCHWLSYSMVSTPLADARNGLA